MMIKKIPYSLDVTTTAAAIASLFFGGEKFGIAVCLGWAGVRGLFFLFYLGKNRGKVTFLQLSGMLLIGFILLNGAQGLFSVEYYYGLPAHIILIAPVLVMLITFELSRVKVWFRTFQVFFLLSVFQTVLIFYQATQGDGVNRFLPGGWHDWATGTVHSANHAAMLIVFCCIGVFFLLISRKKIFLHLSYKQNRLILWSSSLLMPYAVFMTQRKFFTVITIISALSVVISSLFLKLRIQRKYLISGFIVFILLFPFMYGTFDLAYNAINERLYAERHQFHDDLPKVMGYKTLGELYFSSPQSVLVGVGPGLYSSRASVSLSSKDYLAKPSGQRLPVVETSPFIKKYFAEIYSPELYEQLGTSGTFKTPFATAITLLGEYGLVGTLIFLGALGVFFRKNSMFLEKAGRNCLFIIALIVILMFCYNNVLEHHHFTMPFLVTVSFVGSYRYVGK